MPPLQITPSATFSAPRVMLFAPPVTLFASRVILGAPSMT
jgi:hypothetical protein